MTIAVHISFSDTKDDPNKNFNYRCFTILAEKHPEHHFIFIFDKAFISAIITQKNITPLLLSPQIKNRLLEYYWYNFKLPGVLVKHNADLFISNGINCSIRAVVKQCFILPDISFLHAKNLFSRADTRYLKKHFKRSISKATCISTPNDHIKAALSALFPEARSKINVIGYPLNNSVENIEYHEIQNTRERYSEGKEYFLCYVTDVSVSNTFILLKAFSAFKKRQLSNMQLVLVFTTAQKESPVKDFATYKYRNEVKMITPENDKALYEITAAAYAAIYLPTMEIMEDGGLLAIKNNIPLITIHNEFCKSIYNDAALYVSVDEKSIAEKMMLIYKDENLRNSLVMKTKSLAETCSWDNTSTGLWNVLQDT